MNILITSTGRRGYLVKYFKEALGNEGKVYASNSEFSSGLLYADESIISPFIYDENYIPFLVNFCLTHDVGAIISLFDLDLYYLSNNLEIFHNNGIKVIVADKGVINICHDKMKMSAFIQTIGCNAPFSTIDVEEMKEAIRKGYISFPIVVKPRFGTGSLAYYLAENMEELGVFSQKCLRNIKNSFMKHGASNEEDLVLFQQFIDGEEYGIDLFCDLDGIYKGMVIKRKNRMRAGETDEAIVVENELIHKNVKMISDKLTTVANTDIDVIVSDGICYVIDINPRFGGGYPFSHAAGANMPRAIVKWLNNQDAEADLFSAKVGVKSFKDISIVREEL